MVLAVISKIMASFIDFFDILRVTFYPASGHEKSGFYIVSGENIENCLCVFVSPGSIKTDGYLGLFCFYTIDRKIPASGCAADGDDIRKIGGSTPYQKSGKRKNDNGIEKSFRQNRIPFGKVCYYFISRLEKKNLF